ncbi:collagen alpha-1(XIV) chain-like [Watersipora subatra]|uniref:collagen alpha-1(XIV) chain-like n=1 Tax=Watersipora subatra TaxID=2589382 RepID=UPI00355B7B70
MLQHFATMNYLGATLILLAGLCWANEDVLQDTILNHLNEGLVERRAVVNALNSADILNAAKSFAGSLGQKAQLATPQSKAFEDSCLGSSGIGIRPIFPSNPINPVYPWQKIVGKREDKTLANRDIVFVLDDSGSIPSDQFEKAKKAINILIESFCPSKFGNSVTKAGTKQISVVLFDSTVTTEVDFSESSKGLGYLQDKIMSIKHRKGSTATGSALSYVKNHVLGKGSSRLNNAEVSTDVIVITDGQCNINCRILGTEANAIRKMGHGVNLFAMGVANARACELEIITGKGSTMAYGLGDFRNFDRFATAVKEIAQENASKCA